MWSRDLEGHTAFSAAASFASAGPDGPPLGPVASLLASSSALDRDLLADPVAEAAGLPLKPLGWRPWFEVAAATLGIYATIAGTGWMLFGDPVQATLAWVVALMLLGFAVKGASTAPQ